MKDFIKVLRRYVPPYKGYLFSSFAANILSALLNVFSFMLIMPILDILFLNSEQIYTYIPWASASGGNFLETLGNLPAIAKNNFYWYFADLIVRHGATTTLFMLSATLVVMTFVKTGVTYLSSALLIPLRTGVVRDIRNQINDKLLSLNLAFFSSERKGDIIARMSGDVNEVESSIMNSLDMLFKNPVLILIYFGTMVVVSWQLTLFVLVLLPIAGYAMGVIGRNLKKKSLKAQNTWGILMSQIEETIGGLRIIKAFNAEEKISRRFHNGTNQVRKITGRIAYRQQLAHPASEFLGTLTIAIVLAYGGWLILHHSSNFEAPAFMFYLVMFYSIINPAKELSKSVYSIQKGLASIQRIDKILQAENTVKDPETPLDITFNHSIEYRHACFKYNSDNNWELKDINLVIPKGKTVALVGQSGSGKSTLVDLLPRFYDVTSGSICIDGTDIRQTSAKQLRQMMGNVNQDAILFNDTFFNNIAFGVENATEEEVIAAAKTANAHDFIMATSHGYGTNIGDRGGNLSGGQRQRISIARAILKNPQILILDEATSALDTESERLVQEALENLMRHRTTIVIAHRLSTIKNADEICVLHDGKIVERGNHETLYRAEGYYRKLCDLQQF